MKEHIVISVRNLTKTYRLYKSDADRVKETFHPFRKKYHHSFNALLNISFDVIKGDTLGIIGRNGSGKSTLLQIICGILRPTSGTVEVKGRVGALLELGAGFNPEFTGRQNVFLNGAILGLKNTEIEKRFEEIAAFADIGEFIDQPVRTYSSGMYVRLAFAVQACLDHDVLVVDEALAVGDVAFQRKCFARIKHLQKQGRTILFVSHQAGTIVELCNRAILLDQGELLLLGSPKKVTTQYHKLIFSPFERVEELKRKWRKDQNRFNLFDEDLEGERGASQIQGIGRGEKRGSQKGPAQESFYDPGMIPQSTVFYERHGAKILNPHITTLDGKQVNILLNRSKYVYRYTVYFDLPSFQVRFGMLIKTISGWEIAGAVTAPFGEGVEYIEAKTRWDICFQFSCLLNPGVYFINAGVLGVVDSKETYLDRVIDIVMFKVQEDARHTATAVVDLVEHSLVNVIEKSLTGEFADKGYNHGNYNRKKTKPS